MDLTWYDMVFTWPCGILLAVQSWRSFQALVAEMHERREEHRVHRRRIFDDFRITQM